MKPYFFFKFLVSTFLIICVNTDSLHGQNSQADEDRPLQNIGLLKARRITESSGLAASYFIKDAYWTMNDSGNGPEVYLFGDGGQTLAECVIKNAENRDWEAMCSFKRENRPYLIVADVGDNLARRDHCELYIFEEPKFEPRKNKLFSKKLNATKIEFAYQDGPRNCEAVACEPDGSAIYLIEKLFLETSIKRRPGLYRLTLPPNSIASENKEAQKTAALPAIAKRVGEFNVRGVTGMAISPDRSRLAIRNYLNAHLFTRTPINGALPSWEAIFKNSKPRSIAMPLQIQGEAICFSPDNNHLIVTSEIARQPIWKVRISTKE